MKRIITYNLCTKEDDSEEFYNYIDQLGDQLSGFLTSQLRLQVAAYMDYIRREQVEEERSVKEYGLELLLMGTLHQCFFIQEKGVEEPLKIVRYRELMETYHFLQESGEFEEELIRFRPWMAYFLEMSRDGWRAMWLQVSGILKWLECQGNQSLFRYLPELKTFQKKLDRTRSDYGLLGRDSLCYYINMVGARILNQEYREAFVNAERCYVFVPGCMAAAKENCQAIQGADGCVCQKCTQECQIQRIVKRFAGDNVRIRILYHESEMNQRAVSKDASIGVIGIACVPNLLAGGFKAKRLGYIPQCVYLDYCGCHQHWGMGEAVVTALNEKELGRVLDTSAR